jgi:hypothetical protein
MALGAQFLRRIVVGERLPTARLIHQRLSKVLALPVFSADAISSAAYATEEIVLALALAGAAALSHTTAIAMAIAVLFSIVAISYRQTVMAYPSGGGLTLSRVRTWGSILAWSLRQRFSRTMC